MAKLTNKQLLEQQIMFLENNMDKLSPKDLEHLEDLRHQLALSKKGKGAKVKGASYERVIAKIFKKILGIDLVRTPQSGGFAKKSTKADEFRGDITSLDDSINFKLHIEAKCHKTLSLPNWLRQAKSDCPSGKIPCVVFHQHGTSNDYIVLEFNTFYDLLSDNTKKVSTPKKRKIKLKEKWKPIKDYEDYLISNLGMVKSIKNKSERLLKQGVGSSGYYSVALCKNGKPKTFRTHQLVASHFIGEANDRIVNHKDGNKLNNEVTNLEYVSYSDNIQHAYDNKLRPNGEDIYCAKLSNKDVINIRKLLGYGFSRKELSEEFNVSETTILRINNNINYRNPYDLFIYSKNHKTWKLRDWFKQSQEDCPKGKIPCVVFHQAQENKDGKRVSESEEYVALKLEDFLKIVDRNQIIEQK